MRRVVEVVGGGVVVGDACEGCESETSSKSKSIANTREFHMIMHTCQVTPVYVCVCGGGAVAVAVIVAVVGRVVERFEVVEVVVNVRFGGVRVATNFYWQWAMMMTRANDAMADACLSNATVHEVYMSLMGVDDQRREERAKSPQHA